LFKKISNVLTLNFVPAKLIMILGPGLTAISLGSKQIGQVVLNLTLNARFKNT